MAMSARWRAPDAPSMHMKPHLWYDDLKYGEGMYINCVGVQRGLGPCKGMALTIAFICSPWGSWLAHVLVCAESTTSTTTSCHSSQGAKEPPPALISVGQSEGRCTPSTGNVQQHRAPACAWHGRKLNLQVQLGVCPPPWLTGQQKDLRRAGASDGQ